MFGSIVHELMSGNTAVRVLVADHANRGDVLRLLRRISNWVESDPDVLGGLRNPSTDCPF